MPTESRTISDVEVFVRVVECAGYAPAAVALGVSRSHASRLVSALEARLGVRLLNRTTRRVVPTQSGRSFYNECAPLIAALAAAESRAAAEREEAVGVLRIAVAAHMGVDYLVEPLARFQQAHPRIELMVDYSDRKVDLLVDGFDAAIRGGSVDDPALVAKRLWPFRTGVYGAPSYLDARGTPDSPAQLTRHRCLLYGLTAQPRQWRLERGGEEVNTVVAGAVTLTCTRALAVAATGGQGLIFVPEFAVRTQVENGQLRRVLPGWEGPRQWFSFVRAHRTSIPARVRLLGDFLSGLWATPPWSGG